MRRYVIFKENIQQWILQQQILKVACANENEGLTIFFYRKKSWACANKLKGLHGQTMLCMCYQITILNWKRKNIYADMVSN